MREYRTIVALALWAVLAGAAGGADVIRLPTVMPANKPYPGVLASHPEDVLRLAPPETVDEENIWDRPIDARNGFFQSLNLEGTWLAPGRGVEKFGDTQWEIQGNFVLPLPSRRHPLLLMPGYAVHYLDSPRHVDLPPRLHDAYLQLRWLHKLSPRWSADLSVTPGVFSDFEQSSDEAFRITGHFGAMWDWTPMLKIAMGVAYLDRDDLRLLPFAGIIWEPTPDWQIELMVPRPMIARRVYWHGALGDDVQDWFYVAGELGGGSWAIRRTSGIDDVLTYRDLRLILGLERRVLFGIDYRMEVAYSFARKVEFTSATPPFHPSDTVMIRLGATY